jgi:hypothetical protein
MNFGTKIIIAGKVLECLHTVQTFGEVKLRNLLNGHKLGRKKIFDPKY